MKKSSRLLPKKEKPLEILIIVAPPEKRFPIQ